MIRHRPWRFNHPTRNRNRFLVLLMQRFGAATYLELLTEFESVGYKEGTLKGGLSQCIQAGAIDRPEPGRYYYVRFWDGIQDHGYVPADKRVAK